MARVTKEERAKSLLLSHLNSEQQATYLEHGWFKFKGSRGGTYYLVNSKTLIETKQTGTARLLNMQHKHGEMVEARNIWILDKTGHHMPEEDILLGYKLLIELNEKNRELACTTVVSMTALGIET